MYNSAITSIILPSWILIAAGFGLSFFITFIGIPPTIKVAQIKNLYDIPGRRTSHTEPTPRLGGTMIFAGVILSSVLFTGMGKAFELKYIIAGLLVLFFIGLKDDIITLVPTKKAAGQLIASLILVILGGVRISFNNIFPGIPELSDILSILISIILVMTLINSLNFIDGIDGLAAGVGIIASVSFGIWFIQSDQISLAVICFSLTGSLMAFFWYNVLSKKNKIFLGDTGSMVVGFLLAVFLIRFLELNFHGQAIRTTNIAPSLALAILIIPVFDVFRIVFIRIVNHKSPFYGDHNHIHHKVLELSGSHIRATIVILLLNIILIIITLLLRSVGNLILISFLLIICITLSIVPFLFNKER
jgi:UDP-N-acetylmuramyl pentapeptide phosphotransferase/UDP-N-acetylglucosamine-1-phosphate transferase